MPAAPATARAITPQEEEQLLEWTRAELARRKALTTARFTPYRQDPVGFVENVLLGHLWSRQKEIALAVRDNRLVCVPSCHGPGKTSLAARLAAWWIAPWPAGDALVVTMAPTAHQVRGLLWRELNRVHDAGGLPGRMNLTEWFINNELVALGRSPADDNPTAIQGYHAARVLVIIDEACGVAKAIVDGATSLLTNDDCRLVLIGNPDDPSTEFAELCKPGSGAKVIEISAFDTPNFTGEPVPAWMSPLLVGKTWVAERAKRWGVNSPLYQSKVLGKFPEQASDGLVPISALNAAKARGAELEHMPGEDGGDLGVDVARFGDDSTVIFHRRGDYYQRHEKAQGRDLMMVAGMVVKAVRQTRAKRVKIDDAGLGGGVTDRLRELQGYVGADLEQQAAAATLKDVEIIAINVGEAPRADQSDERFKNLRAEVNWQTRERFMEGKITLIEVEEGELDDMLSQAAQIKYKLTSAGEIQIEAKADMKKRTKGVSPDDWDALVLAGAEPQFPGAGILEYYRQLAADAQAQREGKAPKPTAVIQERPAGAPPEAPQFPWAVAPKAAVGLVRLAVSNGASTIYGQLGRRYDVVDGHVLVEPDDVTPLRAIGFTLVP